LSAPEQGRRYKTALKRHLAVVRRRLLGQGVLLAATGVLALVVLLALLVGWSGEVPVWAKSACSAIVLGGAGWLMWEVLLRPLRRVGRLRRFTGRLDAFGGHRNVLVAAEEALRRPERWRGPDVLAGCVERLFDDAVDRVDRLHAADTLGLPRWWPVLLVAAVLTVTIGAGFRLNDTEVKRGVERLLTPLRVEGRPPTAGLHLEMMPAEAVAGGETRVSAVDFGTPRGQMICEIRSGRGAWESLETELEPSWRQRPFGRYIAVLKDLDTDLQVRFTRDGLYSGVGHVRVLHPPLLTTLAVEIRPPAYTGLPSQTLSPAPASLEVLVRSRLLWRGRANQEVARAASVSTAGDTMIWNVSGDSIRADMIITRPQAWRLHLADDRGLTSVPQVLYDVSVRRDEAPRVTLKRDRHDGLMPGDGMLDLSVLAEDDFGVAGLDLLLRREVTDQAVADTTWSRVPMVPRATGSGAEAEMVLGSVILRLDGPDSAAIRTRLALGLVLDASGLELLPGDVLALAVEARDNRRPGPPARGRSRVLRLFLPSAADLLASQVATEAERLTDLDDLRRRSNTVAEELKRIERELKKNPDPDFARRQEIDETLSRQQAMQEELEKLTGDLRRDLEEAASRNLASTEMVDRMERVAELMDEMNNDALDRLREQLNKAVAELSEQDIREAMADVARRQQEFLDKLDRTIALLEELKREQELSGMAAVLEEMMKRQEELLAPESAADTPSGEASAEKQDELAEELEALREQIAEALANLEESSEQSPSPSDEAMREALEEALRELSEGDLQEAMKRAAEEMRKSDGESGSNDAGHEAMRQLASLYHILLQGQQGMQMSMQNYAVETMRRLAHDLLEISRRQETLAGKVPANLRDVRAPELPREEQRLLRAMVALREGLEEALGASGQLPFRLLDSLDGAADTMQRTVDQLEAGYGRQASDTSRSALADINRLVIQLLTSSQMQGQGGSCNMPMPSLGQQLEQMAREQAGLNGITEEMKRQLAQQQREGQEARSGLQRLQREQQGLADQMRGAAELEREQPQGERLLGDLDQLARDMERIADDLGRGQVDEAVLRRQERILSRMLDAHNSVRRRDYARRRESRTGEELFARQTGETDVGESEQPDSPWRLRQEQIEKVPPEYRDLVRRYFQALRTLEDAGRVPAAPGGGS